MHRSEIKKLKVLGKKIRETREKKGFSLKSLQKEKGIDRGTLSRVENGLTDPRYTTLQKIADALEIDIKELI